MKYHVSLLVKPRTERPHRKEKRTSMIRLSGDWLMKLGFHPGETFYVYGLGGQILISREQLSAGVQLTPIESIKMEYERLGIPIGLPEHRQERNICPFK